MEMSGWTASRSLVRPPLLTGFSRIPTAFRAWSSVDGSSGGGRLEGVTRRDDGILLKLGKPGSECHNAVVSHSGGIMGSKTQLWLLH